MQHTLNLSRGLKGFVKRLFCIATKAEFESFSITDCGKIRERNEDSVFISKKVPCYAICDGMGGASAGDIASAMMVEALENGIDMSSPKKKQSEPIVTQAARHVNREIIKYMEEHSLASMGTTLVCLEINEKNPYHGVIYHAGDSRAYRVRNGMVEQLTKDHSYARKVHVEEHKLTPKQRNSLTNAIGIGPRCFLEQSDVDIRTDDIYILCSDGLFKCIENEDLLEVCISGMNKSPEELGRELLQMALDGGGRDNVSIIVVKASLGKAMENSTDSGSDINLKRGEHVDIGWSTHSLPRTV